MALPFPEDDVAGLLKLANWVGHCGGDAIRLPNGTLSIWARGQETIPKIGEVVVHDSTGRFYSYEEPLFHAMYVTLV